MGMLHKIAFVLFAVVFILIPNNAMAAALQPPGEFPITEPLIPIEPGMKPNYSNSVQDDEKTPANVSSGAPESTPEESAQSANESLSEQAESNAEVKTGESTGKSSNKWIVLVIVLIVAAVAGGVYWRRKVSHTSATLGLVGIIFLSTVLVIGVPQSSMAQSSQSGGAVIQRTIEESNSDGTLASEITQQQAESTLNNQFTFTLLAILLIIVAIGAAAMYWKNSHIVEKDLPQNLPPNLDS